MRTYTYYIIFFLVVSTFLLSCQDEQPTEPTVVEKPEWKLDLVEDDPKPDWETQLPESGIYQFSMTGIIQLSDFLEEYADEADEVSAFIGDECRGIINAREYNGKRLFFLYIRGNSSETQKVTLKYYSMKNKKLYVCNELFDFEQNGMYGKISEPAVPPFEESGKYPEMMTIYVVLPKSLPFEIRNQDQFAAFIGDECRSVGKKIDDENSLIYCFEVRGKSDENGEIYFQYYSIQQSGIYHSTETVKFADNTTDGSETDPLSISFQPII